MSKHIIICTTAINRSNLHKSNIPEWYKYFNSVDKKIYKLKWLINIDYIEKLKEPIETTKKNFESIIKDIPIQFVKKDEVKDGNFLSACKRICRYVKINVNGNKINENDVIIVWLEDDWKLKPENIPFEYLINTYLSNMTYINLSYIRNNYIHALAPSIISYPLWKKIHLEALEQQKANTDPESCIGIYYTKHFGRYEDINNITIINKYKSHGKGFIEHFSNTTNSFYSYDEKSKKNIILGNYIKKERIKHRIKDKITFIRITCSSCYDIGRSYMEEQNLKKVGVHKDKDFYK